MNRAGDMGSPLTDSSQCDTNRRVPQFLLPAQAALVLGMSPQGVKKAERTGRLRCAAMAGKVRLFALEEVLRFKAQREERMRGERALDQA